MLYICDARATIEVRHFFSEVPQLGELKTSPKNRFGEKQNCYRIKNPMA